MGFILYTICMDFLRPTIKLLKFKYVVNVGIFWKIRLQQRFSKWVPQKILRVRRLKFKNNT